MRPARPHHPAAVTLIECVMAMALASIILGILTSLVLIAGKATPSDRSPLAVSVRTSNALDLLADELRLATSITSVSATSLEFSLPDRDGDGEPDTVRYEWSGTAGTPLLRSYKPADGAAFGTPATLVTAVDSLAFTVLSRTLYTRSAPSITVASDTSSTSAVSLLDAFESSSSLGSTNIKSSTYLGQVVVPSLPAGTTSFKITYIQLQLAKVKSPKGTYTVSLRQATGNSPTSTVVASVSLSESALTGNHTWTSVTFSPAPDLDPAKSYALVVTSASDKDAVSVRTRTTGASPGSPLVTSSNGTSWSAVSGASLLYRVYGTTTSTAASTTPIGSSDGAVEESTVLTGINLRLTPTAPGSPPFDTYIPLLNLPPPP